MKDLLRALNPMRNPAWQAYEKLNARLMDTALRDPFFLSMSAGLLKNSLQLMRMQEQWLALFLGGTPGAVTHAQVSGLKSRLSGLEDRLNQAATAARDATPADATSPDTAAP